MNPGRSMMLLTTSIFSTASASLSLSPAGSLMASGICSSLRASSGDTLRINLYIYRVTYRLAQGGERMVAHGRFFEDDVGGQVVTLEGQWLVGISKG